MNSGHFQSRHRTLKIFRLATRGFMVIFAFVNSVGCASGRNKAPEIDLETPIPRPPYLDQISYVESLKRARSDIYEKGWPHCVGNLRIRSRLRSELLATQKDFDQILKKDYPEKLQSLDQKWMSSHQKFLEQKKDELFKELYGTAIPEGFKWSEESLRKKMTEAKINLYPGFYDSGSFVSYQVGPTEIPFGPFVYKIFFEFQDPIQDLSPEIYLLFSQKLEQAGFVGDSKIPMIHGWPRFQYNNVIVHALDIRSALIAERVGIQVFGTRLSATSRGVDVQNELTQNESYDWNHFLCSVNSESLPPEILKFVAKPEK